MATLIKQEDDIRELDKEQAREAFEAAVQRRLKMTTDDFLKALDRGDFRGREEEPKIMRLLSMLPLVR